MGFLVGLPSSRKMSSFPGRTWNEPSFHLRPGMGVGLTVRALGMAGENCLKLKTSKAPCFIACKITKKNVMSISKVQVLVTVT